MYSILLVWSICLTFVTPESHESRTLFPAAFVSPPGLWKRDTSVKHDKELQVDIALSLSSMRVSEAERTLMEISESSSPRFGRHLDAGQVSQMFAPDKDHVHKVVEWLTSAGIPLSSIQSSATGDHLFFNVTVSAAEGLLRTRYVQYSDEGETHGVFEEYSLPETLSSLVDYVTPALPVAAVSHRPNLFTPAHDEVTLDGPRNQAVRRQNRNIDCFRNMTPHCLRALYNIPANSSLPAHPANSLGVYTPAWATWLEEDIDAFFAEFEPHLAGRRPIIEPINGGYRQWDVKLSPFNLEPNLDYQYTMSLAYPLQITNLQVGDKYLMATINTMLAAFDKHYCKTALDPNYDPIYPDPQPGGYNSSDCGTHKAPRVIAIMYAWNEAFYSAPYLERQCLEFLKLGLQGVTVIGASADRGPADQLGGCVDRETGAANASEGLFSSVFPASCPWITTVGGTQLQPAAATWSEGAVFPDETALDNTWMSSGGGFSRHFAAPAYQAGLTAAYLNGSGGSSSAPGVAAHLANLSSHGYFDPRGRGYPDVSALGLGFLVNMYGQYYSVRGTSASAPVVASMVARVNDARLHAGKGTVGFINPVLYAHRDAIMRDVKNGTNHGCGVDEAFPATEGWDAVTGLGSPDFEKLLEVYMRLP
ncbi:ribonuclease T2 [Apiospora arundinis]